MNEVLRAETAIRNPEGYSPTEIHDLIDVTLASLGIDDEDES